MANFNFLHDIKMEHGNAVRANMLISPALAPLLHNLGVEVVRLYQSKAASRSGKLKNSAYSHVPNVGGRNDDRLVGKVTVGGPSVVTYWSGYSSMGEYNPATKKTKRVRRSGKASSGNHKFYYGEYHEEGTKKKGRSYRYKNGADGYHELREVAERWRSN